MKSQEQREQLKQQYKKHYRKMREAKKQLQRTQRTRNISAALQDMDTSELMASFDTFLFEVKSTVAHVEAKLDVALEDLKTDAADTVQNSVSVSSPNKTKARVTLENIKNEMGMLHREIENKAEALNVEKTVGGTKQQGKSGQKEKID